MPPDRVLENSQNEVEKEIFELSKPLWSSVKCRALDPPGFLSLPSPPTEILDSKWIVFLDELEGLRKLTLKVSQAYK